MKGKPGNPGLKGRLVDKSVEAYILALETINRLSIKYRIETFCYLICNAWELLLKAKILNDTGNRNSIFQKQKRGAPKRTYSLRECIQLVILNENDPVRRNIERIVELRDESVHLVFSETPTDVLCLFQASVLNFHRCLFCWFRISLSDRVPVGMMTIVYDMQPHECDLSNKKLKRELGRDAFDFLSRYCAGIKQEYDALERPAEFFIGIEYRLALTKKFDEADISLSVGPDAEMCAKVIEVARDPSTTHPFRQKEVKQRVSDALQVVQLNMHDVQSVVKVYGIQRRAEFFYRGTVIGNPAQYSQAFVDWLIEQYGKDVYFFKKAREKAKALP